MKVLFLGTGAADWNGKKTGEFFRRNSSILIDRKILVDPGPGVMDALEEWQVAPEEIQYIINTHKHKDHFCLETLEALEKIGAVFCEEEPGGSMQLGEYTVQVLRANHSIAASHFLISDGKSRLFYGLDGAWLQYEEVQAIKEKEVDLAILDATVGFIDGDYRVFEHNNLNMVLEMKKTLSMYVKEFCITHMARTLHTDHKTLADKMAEYNIITAFDGMELEC